MKPSLAYPCRVLAMTWLTFVAACATESTEISAHKQNLEVCEATVYSGQACEPGVEPCQGAELNPCACVSLISEQDLSASHVWLCAQTDPDEDGCITEYRAQNSIVTVRGSVALASSGENTDTVVEGQAIEVHRLPHTNGGVVEGHATEEPSDPNGDPIFEAHTIEEHSEPHSGEGVVFEGHVMADPIVFYYSEVDSFCSEEPFTAAYSVCMGVENGGACNANTDSVCVHEEAELCFCVTPPDAEEGIWTCAGAEPPSGESVATEADTVESGSAVAHASEHARR